MMSHSDTNLVVASDKDPRAIANQPAWRRMAASTTVWVLLLNIALVAVFTFMSPNHVYFSIANLRNILLNGAEPMLLAVAMAMLLGAGIIDLSVGANLVLASAIGAKVMVLVSGGQVAALGAAAGSTFSNVLLAILLGLAASIASGILFGLVNGLIITRARVNALIATLGTMSIGTGVVLLLTGGTDIGGFPPELQNNFGLVRLFGVIPLPALVALFVIVAAWVTIRYLRFGLYTLAIGSSRTSADRAGIMVDLHLVKLTVLSGAIAGLAGFLNLAHFGSTAINGHGNDPLAAITAAIIGGAALAGGRISIMGTVWGATLAIILLSGLVVIGVSAFWQLIMIGAILICAVAIDQMRTKSRETR